ncbi:hypothetical protein, partial [Membranihabitans maritimus]|uniref:hypothetical protein n=1 Tax=Membranihabitans maritimus TaxID=2904244 RepID=UPI001F1CE96D
KSRMMREYHVRFCEKLGGKFPGFTRQPLLLDRSIPLLYYILCIMILDKQRMYFNRNTAYDKRNREFHFYV